jgi:hypothetical protein
MPEKKKQVLFTLMLPGPYDKLDEQFREGIEGLEEQWPDMAVSQKVDFEPFDKKGGDWLMSAAWKGDERTLQVEPDAIFKERRWDMVKRAVDLRESKYWRREGQKDASKTNGEPVWDVFMTWRREQRERLGSVEVRFMGLVTPHPVDAAAASQFTRTR